jgi:sortase B
MKTKIRKNIKNKILDMLIVIFALIAVGSAAYIGIYYYRSSSSQKDFEQLKNDIDYDYIDENGNDIMVEVEASSDTESPTNLRIFKKYLSLYMKNTDFIGWLRIDGTDIDYPVMYTPDDMEYYLHKNFDKEYSYAGTLFIDENCTPVAMSSDNLTEDVSDNIIIYGHNMKSGTMFHHLLDYEDEDFYKEHKYITFDTLAGEGTYEVIATFRTKVYSDDDTEHYKYYKFYNAADKDEFNEFVNYAKSNTPYAISETASYGDKLITLSTCSYHTTNGRYVVVAKKIS